MRTLIAALLVVFAAAAPARAATRVGKDYGGADLTVANGDVVQGTFTNVGLFSLPAGATVSISVGIPFVLYAATVSIRGTLDGRGRGGNSGAGGSVGDAGAAGTSGSSAGSGGGGGGSAADGGGGGGYGGAGGAGSGGTGTAGSVYGSTGVTSVPLSSDDVFQGSGGGGGGGGSSKVGAAGGSGGGAVYIEASSMTIDGGGKILVDGSGGGTAAENSVSAHPGGGGGGSGGGVLLRITGPLVFDTGAELSADGGNGGDVSFPIGGFGDPGGGGGGGRVMIFHEGTTPFDAFVSTSVGEAGKVQNGTPSSPPAIVGSSGTFSVGQLASSPTMSAVGGAFVTSITWAWSAGASWGDAAADSRGFRLYTATPAAKIDDFHAGFSAGPGATSLNETGLTPNTTYSRMLTARTAWGDSHVSGFVSTFTRAADPFVSTFPFTSVASSGLTYTWTASSNPVYTEYRVERSTSGDFAGEEHAAFLVGVSSVPAALSPNASYYFRVRARGLGGDLSLYAPTRSTATAAEAPSSVAFIGVFATSVAVAWNNGSNPADTAVQIQLSVDSFATVHSSTETTGNSAAFSSLPAGSVYSVRMRSRNRLGSLTDFSAVLSTSPAALSDLSAPTVPGAPNPDRAFSYDGSAVFSWTAATHGTGILEYKLRIGSTPGGSDFLADTSVGNVLFYGVSGLPTRKTYFAQVQSVSNGGVTSPFSAVGSGVTVFTLASEAPVEKPKNWPNPFDPRSESTNIGFSLAGAADVTVRIYSLRGTLVYEETRAFGSGGNQVWSWDGKSGGRTVPPGGYVVQVAESGAAGPRTRSFKIAVIY